MTDISFFDIGKRTTPIAKATSSIISLIVFGILSLSFINSIILPSTLIWVLGTFLVFHLISNLTESLWEVWDQKRVACSKCGSILKVENRYFCEKCKKHITIKKTRK